MKRFILFAFEQYYPSGGWNDFHSSHDSLEESLVAAAKRDHIMGLWQVIDTQNWKIVADSITGLIK